VTPAPNIIIFEKPMRRPDLRALVDVELLSSLLQQLHFFQNTSPGSGQPTLLFILRFFSPWIPNGGIDVLEFYLYVDFSGPGLIALRVCVWLIVSLLGAGL
jgi:hypothetical protein